nr:glycosyl hydrolase 115 family protein [uncultured Pedobacter sp.]
MKHISSFLFAIIFVAGNLFAQQNVNTLRVADTFSENNFPLVHQKKSATIYYDGKDAEVVANAFASDIEKITGIKPKVDISNKPNQAYAVIVGTVGKSQLIDQLIASKKINPISANKWEEFQITLVNEPLKGVKQALVIAGSDRRGTSFGVFTLSRMLGVSPWIWWADVNPKHQDNLYLAGGKPIIQSPSVQYRGIFLNDEDWGLQPWAAKNMDTDIKDIGPKTYTKIFELLLRLKANYIWPAMHPSTKAFYHYPMDPVMADKYAIVVGSSHCEPMLRNNVFEWSENFENEYGKKPGEWRYDLNKAEIDQYWTDRLKQSRNYESVYTIGMRGIHDGSMPGPKDPKGKLKLLDEVIQNQRQLFKENFTKDVSQIPQIFCPYKEVLTLYRMGLNLPDDVTIVWADDNHGYVRQLSNPEEQKRIGGSGVYYHISYWGSPQDYLWLTSTSPTLISYELSKAYAYDAKKLWVINVGDIKPAELEIQFSMDLAWDVDKWKPENANLYTLSWAKETFGDEFAETIAAIKNEYYTLAASGKPEHLPYINFPYYQVDQRLQAYQELAKKAATLKSKIPARLQDAYFEMIYYPVMGATLMNEKIFYAQKSITLAKAGKDEALDYAKKSEAAFEKIKELTKIYNKEIAHGKWDGIMDYRPRKRPVFDMPEVATQAMLDEGKKNPLLAKLLPAPMIIKGSAFSTKSDAEKTKVTTLNNLGISNASVSLLPFYFEAFDAGHLENAPFVTYNVDLTEGQHSIEVKCLPTQGVYDGRGVRYAIAVNNAAPQVIDIAPKSENSTWQKNVLQGFASGKTVQQFHAGKNTIKIYLLDPGIVINQLEIR